MGTYKKLNSEELELTSKQIIKKTDLLKRRAVYLNRKQAIEAVIAGIDIQLNIFEK